MSIFAYLIPWRAPLKMPDAEKQPDKCGIKWEGPILSGKLSFKEAIEWEERRIRETRR